MSPQEKHEKAIAKIRAQIFRKYSASDYGMVPDSEKILPPSEHYESLGGLEYRLSGKFTRVKVSHASDALFEIVTFGMIKNAMGGNNEHSRFVVTVPFPELDLRLYKILKS